MPTSTRAAAEPVDCLPDAPALVAGPTDDPTVVVTLGSGDRGVVLAPQDGGGPCQWAEQAERLAAEGYHVATFLWVEDGATSIQGAADALREAGAREVAYVGASKGGAYVAALADSLDPSPVAVIALSPPRQFGSVVAGPDVGSYTGPLLVVASTGDRNVSPAHSRDVSRAGSFGSSSDDA